MSQESAGVFPLCFNIGSGASGSIDLRLNLLVDTTSKTVFGYATITQEINPPINIRSKVDGRVITITINNELHQLVVVGGTPVNPHNPYTNLYLWMVLKNWASGTAYYEFQDNAGLWITVNDAAVKQTPCIWSKQEA